MLELFGYISDTSSNYSDDVYTESYLDDDYDIDDVITESDLALIEFNQYVQEGVGVKILVGISFAAMLGGLIAVIIKLISGKSDKSTAVKAKKAEKTLKDKMKNPNNEKKTEKTLKDNMKNPNNEKKTARFGPGELVSYIGFELMDAAVIMEEMSVESFEKSYEMETKFIEGLGDSDNEKARRDYKIWTSNTLAPYIQKISSEYVIKMKNVLLGTGISVEDFMSGKHYNMMNTEDEEVTLSEALVQVKRIENILEEYSKFGKRLNVLQNKYKERESKFPQFKEGNKQSQEYISAAIKTVEISKSNMDKMLDTLLNKF